MGSSQWNTLFLQTLFMLLMLLCHIPVEASIFLFKFRYSVHSYYYASKAFGDRFEVLGVSVLPESAFLDPIKRTVS